MFEYIGLSSLRDTRIFYEIYARAVTDTGLAYAFEGPPVAAPDVDAAYKFFSYQLFLIVTDDKLRDSKKFWMIVAMAIHTSSLFPAFAKGAFAFGNEKVLGIHRKTAERNPNEVIALTFGIAIAQIQFEHMRHPTGLILSPAPVELKMIKYLDLKRIVQLIAENRNRNIRANNRQFFRTFSSLARLVMRLRRRQLSQGRSQYS